MLVTITPVTSLCSSTFLKFEHANAAMAWPSFNIGRNGRIPHYDDNYACAGTEKREGPRKYG